MTFQETTEAGNSLDVVAHCAPPLESAEWPPSLVPHSISEPRVYTENIQDLPRTYQHPQIW